MTDTNDLFRLAAEARPLIQQLHAREDVVLQFKSDASEYSEDRLSDFDRQTADHPGRFSLANKFITLNLDALISDRRPMPESLATLDDFRKNPVLAGVAAHSAAHARFSIWDQNQQNIPSQLPNPDFDPAHPVPTKDYEIEEDDGSITIEQHEDPDYRGPESFPLDVERGRLMEVAGLLEEARVERLAMRTFGKTFREALKFSSTHLTLESLDEGDEDNDGMGESALDSALRTMILIGGRTVAGTLGFDARNRAATQKVLGNAQKVIETALQEQIVNGGDPFHEVMGLVSDAVFDNIHDDAIPHLEYARRILNIIHPEDKDNPDNPGAGSAGGEGAGGAGMALAAGQAPGEKPKGEESGEQEGPVSGNLPGEDDGEGSGKSEEQQALEQALNEMEGDLKDALNEMAQEMAAAVAAEEKSVDEELDGDGTNSFGAVRSKNEKPPHIDRYEQPTAADRELARKAEKWMRDQIEPTVTEFERGQWMPGGGTRFNPRNWVRDNLSGRQANERTDWEKTDEIVKQAPPVKVAVALDGSGSMSSKARQSASIGYAIAVASASLPESRTAALVFGHDALLTQEAGHGIIPREVGVAKNNAGWENFAAAAAMIEEQLGIEDASMDEGDPSNVLIIIVSDLMYGGQGQGAFFTKKTAEWKERGFRTVVVGARESGPERFGVDQQFIERVAVEDLFEDSK